METDQDIVRNNKLANLSYLPIRDVSHLSPYHERVSIQRKYLQKKEHLRSILIMGHLQKMQFNAINNRSIQTMLKSKKAEQMSKRSDQMSKKKQLSIYQFSQDKYKNQIRIDNRKKNRTSQLEKVKEQVSHQEQMQKVCQQLIDQYLKKAKQQNLLEQGMDRKKIVEQACNTIKNQLANQYSIRTTQHRYEKVDRDIRKSQRKHKSLLTSQQSLELPAIKQVKSNKKSYGKSQRSFSLVSANDIPINLSVSDNLKKLDKKYPKTKNTQRYRSITEIECTENLKKLQVEKDFLTKQRNLQEKMFLRKMKMIGMKNIRVYKSNYRAHQKDAHRQTPQSRNLQLLMQNSSILKEKKQQRKQKSIQSEQQS